MYTEAQILYLNPKSHLKQNILIVGFNFDFFIIFAYISFKSEIKRKSPKIN